MQDVVTYLRISQVRMVTDPATTGIDGLAHSMEVLWFMDSKSKFICHDATFDPLQGGKWTGGGISRTLPVLPIKLVDGKLVVFVGYADFKRG